MRQKVWGGLILFTTSLSLLLNVYTLLKQEENISIDYEIPAKPVVYAEDTKVKEEKIEFEEVKNIKLGRRDPFSPLIKEEEISFPKKIVEVKKIERIPYVLRGILKGKEKVVAILESENGEKSFVVEEGQRVENYKIEKIDDLQRRIILKDSKGNFYYIKM
jgi:hypothetical protein